MGTGEWWFGRKVPFAFNFIFLPFLSLLSLFLCFYGSLFLFYIPSVFILAFLSLLSYFVTSFSPFYIYLISFLSFIYPLEGGGSSVCRPFYPFYLSFLCFVGLFLPPLDLSFLSCSFLCLSFPPFFPNHIYFYFFLSSLLCFVTAPLLLLCCLFAALSRLPVCRQVDAEVCAVFEVRRPDFPVRHPRPP
jgi:hypothetical protein